MLPTTVLEKFWKYVKSETRFQHRVADLVRENGTACTLEMKKLKS